MYIKVGGSKGESDWKLLRQGFKQGTRIQLGVITDDVGEVSYLKFGSHTPDNWYLDRAFLETDHGKEEF